MDFQAYNLTAYPSYSYIKLKTSESTLRNPIHLCCIIDTSASMEYDMKLQNVKYSLHFLLDFLGPQDRLSLITFSDTAEIIINKIINDKDGKEFIRNCITTINVYSNTNLGAAIVKSRETLISPNSNITQGIIILTDGDTNVGLTKQSDIIELTRTTIRQFDDTSISTIGYGDSHNSELLQHISIEGNGVYYIVNNIEDVAKVFGNILGELQTCTYERLKITLPGKVNLLSSHLLYKYVESNNTTEITIGNMPSDTELGIIIEASCGTNISLTGYNIRLQNNIAINTSIGRSTDHILQLNGIVHCYRVKVAIIIDLVRRYIMHNTLSVMQLLNTRLNSLINKISSYNQTISCSHYMWNVLLEELNTCMYAIQNNSNNNENIAHVLTQHSSYLSRMRGIPASMSTSYNNSPSNSTFSNTIQQQIATELLSNMTQHLSQYPLNSQIMYNSDIDEDPVSICS